MSRRLTWRAALPVVAVVVFGNCGEEPSEEEASVPVPAAPTAPAAEAAQPAAPPAVALAAASEGLNELLSRCARGSASGCDEARAGGALGDEMLARIADRCDADETLYCELRDNLRVAELYADGAIVVPGLSAAETRDLVACSVGDSAACEAMRYPGLLGDGAHALFSERCDAGDAVYCRLIENLASGG